MAYSKAAAEAKGGGSAGGENPGYGCTHYRRKCQFLAPCCPGRRYTCRFCHDEAEKHVLDRTKVQHVVCLSCGVVQKVGRFCVSCGILFGTYFCQLCRLYDDEDKNQFHCDGCGICRVGGKNNFFHCPTCNMCLAVRLRGAHKCVVNSSRGNCPVCLEDLHTSRIPCHVPPCGHLIHRNCYDDLIKSSNYSCPLCSLSMVDMAPVWQDLDRRVASTPQPSEYLTRRVRILCRDCHKPSVVGFHTVALKCAHCGSYNTCRDDDNHSQGRRHSTSLDSSDLPSSSPPPPPSLSSAPLPPLRERQLQSLFHYLFGQVERLREVHLSNSSGSS